ncbi:hypothetical protein ACFLZP_01020 [Patescibacteria group bacterium]
MTDFDFSAFEARGIKRIGEINPYITLACNLRCRYCYMYPFLANSSNKTDLMDVNFLLEMVSFFCQKSGGLDRLTLLGGEPVGPCTHLPYRISSV